MRCAITNTLLGVGGLLVVHRLTRSSVLTPQGISVFRRPRRHVSAAKTTNEEKGC